MMSENNPMIQIILQLLQANVYVAIFAGGGYPGHAEKYEQSLAGLIEAFNNKKIAESATSRLFVVGGECNYLLRYDAQKGGLNFIDQNMWQSQEMLSWQEGNKIPHLLSEAQWALQENSKRLNLEVEIIKKDRAVGAIPREAILYEVLEDLAIGVQNNLINSRIPFCAFNNGTHVFVDVGNKSIGIEAIMSHLDINPSEVLHVGDRFTRSGSDMSVRDCCCILWVVGIQETEFFIKLLLKDIRKLRIDPYIE
eukprot:TRINITY_DN16466_c2_g2_i3.p1 TRINITY_DN16466_c2_g2~~TRINITY_DN16466_c2_g2_i3.p1  ORF type:complete len:252 (+),score=37.36 TRINITY_DN16466_c2_g2_i3:137-892(+)